MQRYPYVLEKKKEGINSASQSNTCYEYYCHPYFTDVYIAGACVLCTMPINQGHLPSCILVRC